MKVGVLKGEQARVPGNLSVGHSDGHQGPVEFRTKRKNGFKAKRLIN